MDSTLLVVVDSSWFNYILLLVLCLLCFAFTGHWCNIYYRLLRARASQGYYPRAHSGPELGHKLCWRRLRANKSVQLIRLDLAIRDGTSLFNFCDPRLTRSSHQRWSSVIICSTSFCMCWFPCNLESIPVRIGKWIRVFVLSGLDQYARVNRFQYGDWVQLDYRPLRKRGLCPGWAPVHATGPSLIIVC